ncbi:MAG TPA: sodium/proton-translocating pyrophosphatase [Polyangiaceae bacterium]|nr:sodium/proton-translocating pyrophosphatase [Polyangiaceae bacterium]
MTQLALLLALSLIGSVLSYAFGRLEVRRVGISATIQRAEGALERAALGLLRVGALRGLVLLTAPAVGLVGFGLLGGPRAGVSGLGRGAFLLLALVSGALSTLAQARVTLTLGARASAAGASASARGSTRALRPLIRAAAAGAVFGEALGLLGVSCAFAGLFAVRGGFAGASDSAELAIEVVRLLPAFALGAAVMALSLAHLGSVSAAAAQAGSAVTGTKEFGLSPGDARDPALLASLVGQLAGELLPRALTAYAASVGATISLALLAVSASAGAAALTGLVLVLLVRAFGAIASVCGVFAARSADDESTLRALLRGQASALFVALFGLGAALFWLERDKMPALFVSGALGLILTTLLGLLAWLPLRRQQGRVSREPAERHASSAAAVIVRGAGTGFGSLWSVLLAPALLLAVAERLSQLAPGALLLTTFAAGALALGPFSLALGGFGALASPSRSVAALARLELEPTRRHSGFDEAVLLGDRAGAAHGAVSLGLGLWLGLLAFPSASVAAASGNVGLAALATGLGVAIVVSFGARATRGAITTARLVGAEVERQMPDATRSGAPTLPADFTPSYKGCLEALTEGARKLPIVEVAALLLSPFVLAAVLREGGLALTPTLLSFGLASLLTGVVVSLGGRATRAVLAEQRRRARADASTGALADADTFGAFLGVTATANIEGLALALALTVICLAPLLR